MTLIREGRPEVRSSERALSVFISSVMRPELEDARDAAVRCLDGVRLFKPWAFERTPASSEPVDMSYLVKVREADFLVWLVERDITPPVQAEIIEALTHNIRMLVFKLPCSERGSLTEEYLGKVRPHCKYCELADGSALENEVRLAFEDEIIRAVRGGSRVSAAAVLEGMGQASIARCIVRWKAAGLPETEARAMARDRSIGMDVVIPTAQEDVPLVVLTGEVGAGKSLVAERLFQRAIEDVLNDTHCPVPLYLKAKDCMIPLEEKVRKDLERVGDPVVRGLFLVVDGLDECSTEHSYDVLRQCEVLVRQWKESRVVLTSRPIPALQSVKEQTVAVPLLSDHQACSLISRVAGREVSIGSFHIWLAAIQDAIRRPLFAILLGNHLRTQDARIPKSRAQLLAHMVEEALQEKMGSLWHRKAALCRLARLSTDRNGGSVPFNDIGTIEERSGLAETRLISLEDDLVEFALPILLQWFAAQSLASEQPSPEDLTKDPVRLERWKYPLAILLSTESFEVASPYIAAAVARNPALAAQIISDGLARWGLDAAVDAPPASECGSKIRETMQCWADSIGRLADLIAPVDSEGRVLPIGVDTDGAFLASSWYYGTRRDAEILHAPDQMEMTRHAGDWREIRSARPGRQPCWPWLWTLGDLHSRLKTLLEKRSLPTGCPVLQNEFLWKIALALDGKGSHFSGQIPLKKLKKRLDESYDETRLTLMGKVTFLVGPVKAEIARQLDVGLEFMYAPWPGPDQSHGSMVWDVFSPERQLERARAIYLGALQAFEQLTSDWFAALSHRMPITTLLPVCLRGRLKPSIPGNGIAGGPVLSWYMEPLEKGPSTADIQFGDEAPFPGDSFFVEELEKVRKRRRSAADWLSLSYSHGFLDIFKVTPATDLVYEWLEKDLRDASWLSQ